MGFFNFLGSALWIDDNESPDNSAQEDAKRTDVVLELLFNTLNSTLLESEMFLQSKLPTFLQEQFTIVFCLRASLLTEQQRERKETLFETKTSLTIVQE